MENAQVTSFKERRDNFMEIFKNDEILYKRIPEVAAGLMKKEFGINIYNNSHIPIVFMTAWTEILKRLGSQNFEEYGMDVCGVRIEYRTELSESDKNTNIVPQMRPIKTPIFQDREHTATIGASFNDELLTKYNNWRTVYAVEALTDIENGVFNTILNTYGINLMVSAAIYPILGATYVAGVQIARTVPSHMVNMYNIFEIHIIENDEIVLVPLSFIKQWLKNDSKK